MTIHSTGPVDGPTVAVVLEGAYRDYRNRPAIVTPSKVMTYEDVAASAHAVAACIHAATGAIPGRAPVVAVVLERCPEFVATVLGVLGAGASYLPLDPDAPDAYMRQVLGQARPVLVVTSQDRAVRMRSATSAPVRTFLDLISRPESGLRHESLGVTAPSDPAYVIYTSGSTGTPKGVLVPHTALLNSTAARTDRYGPAGRVLLLHSPSFDLSTGVLFWTLLTGGTLVINPARLNEVAATLDLVHRHEVTHLIYPASLYSIFLDRAAARPPTSLQAVGIGSEWWSPILIGRHAGLLPATSLVNEFGPTEACVCSSYGLVYDAATGQQASMTIGKPVRNTGYLILDPDGHLNTNASTQSRTGELGITGANLALGYLDQPDLTRQRFVAIGGERVYRTGDIVEQDLDGNFAFLHRADRQVQVGGHRVEPGHVETVLMSHPAVLQAHVTSRSTGTDSPVLIAYVVPVPGTESPRRIDGPNLTRPEVSASFADTWESHLRERLPAYLVPSTYVVMAELPRTPAGKIDNRALPDPAVDAAGPDTDDGIDPLQRQLVGMAAGILGVTHIPVNRSLPSLGANSLALIRLSAAIAADLGVEISINALFSARTITQIADFVQDAAPTTRLLPPTNTTAQRDPVKPIAPIPLSGQQQQIWVLSQLAPHALAYNTQFSLHLNGPLGVEALQQALTLIVKRHEILRTTFHHSSDSVGNPDGLSSLGSGSDGGSDGPVQVIHEPWPASVDVVDLTGFTGPARDGELADRMRSAMATGFEVSKLPLVRWHLFRVAPQAWRLLQVEHHFAHDGWSAQLFLTELRDAYTAIVAGRDPLLPDLPAQYRDYAAWYRAWRGTSNFTDQATYWRAHLEGCPPEGATFSPDRPRPATRSFRGDRLSAHMRATVVDGLDALAARYEVSRFAVFLTAFALHVWQHTGEQDIVLGSALLNRRQPGTDRLLGMFVNALPLRIRVDPSASISDLLHATMTVLLGAQDHQELPLLDLLAHLDRPRDPGRNPLFNLMFAFHDTPRPHLRMGALEARLVIEHNATAKGDLNVVCVPDPHHHGDGPAGMTILWEYDTDLFDPDTAAELLTGYVTILTSLASLSRVSDRPVRDLNLLGADQRARLLAESTGPVDEVPFAVLHAGFDAALAVRPDAVAMEQAGSRWTYRQLGDHVTRLQRHLTARGIRAGSIVALVCPAGFELVTAILATLRTGAAYVCLDLAQPPARTLAALQDAGAAAIVTAHTVADNSLLLEVRGEVTVLYADDVPDELPDADDTDASDVSPKDPAYLVYTSGSTGTPKAVVATHRNACTATHARSRFLDTAGTATGPVRTLVTLPVIFDVAPHMIMWTLWCGGTVVFPDSSGQAQDPDQVLSLIARSAISHVNFTASFYRHLLTRVPARWESELRVVAVGGEACRADDVREHVARLPAVALDHEYGPTETTVWCSAQRLHPAAPTESPQLTQSSRVTVGGPLTNYTMMVLDPAGRLLPVGAPGELFVGGDAVAGYHRRPDLTRERFITPETGVLAGRRLYRTGDRSRLTPAGFEILGRLDDQVKVRGFRVEPGEISACLLQHPDVSDAAVLVRGTPEHPLLIAYIATAGRRDVLDRPLRTWLAQRLPSYMLPAAYVITDRLPRTTTGKLQPGDLPEPPGTAVHGPGHELGHGPATDRQWLLTQVWRDVLHQTALGIDDDFFASGGDSLQAIQAAARATTLGVNVSVTDILAAPTIRALDILIGDRPERTPLPLVERRPAGTTLELTPIQIWFFSLQLAHPDHFHQARLFEIPAHCDLSRLRTALAWTVGRHDAFRTRFAHTGAHTGTGWTAVLHDGPRPDLVNEQTLPRESSQPRAEHLDTALRALHHPITIVGGRLAAFTIVHEPDGSQAWLYLIAHHLIVDVVSWQILTGDIEHAYRMLTTGQELPIGAAPGIASRIDDTGHQDDQEETLHHWRALRATVKPRLSGTGATAPAAALAERVRVHRRLSTRTGTYLRLEVPRLHGIGAQALLLAALRRALSRHSSEGGLYVWLEGHGRTRRGHELNHVVGWLTSLHPTLFTLDDADPARLVDEASSIHRQIGAASEASASFSETVLSDPGSTLHRQLTNAGLPQVTFNYLGQPTATADRLLQPATAPEGATIGDHNVLPTPFDVTITPALDGTVTCHFSADPAFLTAEDVRQVAERFAAEIETAARLVPLTAAPLARPARTLVLIHPVGGLLDWYTHLVAGLGRGWDCYGIPRDRTGDDTTMQALARKYLARIRAACPAGSYTLAGWCLGGPLAYEIALQAQAQGDGARIDDVIMIDPPRAEKPTNPRDVLIAHIHHACPHQTRPAVVAALIATEQLPIPERAPALVDLLGPAGPGRPDHPLLGQLLMRLSDHAAMSAWQPSGQVPHLTVVLPRVVTSGNEDAEATWRARGATLTVTTIPGDHESMLTADKLHQALTTPSDVLSAGAFPQCEPT